MIQYGINLFILMTGVLSAAVDAESEDVIRYLEKFVPCSLKESDLTYHLYTRNNLNDGVVVRNTALRKTGFSTSRNTVFLVHGWRNNYTSPFNVLVKDALLARHNLNIFVVDWAPIANRNYISAKNCANKMGVHMAGFVKSLMTDHHLGLDNIGFIGFSLGAHICGDAGAELEGKVDFIVGLDPSGPMVTLRNIDTRLDQTDARFVHVIHTNVAGLIKLGYKAACGHADYYVNGPSIQPGCGVDLTGACSHSRAYLYYAESVSSETNRFVALKCSSFTDYEDSLCDGNPKSLMGGYPVDKEAFGTYYLKTDSESPFAKRWESNNQFVRIRIS